ncbi:MAG: hypothetical protein ABIM30_06880 [candidate division WOR-3 bacterium]
MFWESIPQGYAVLLDYRIWIAAIIYGGLHWGSLFLIGSSLPKYEEPTFKQGCITSIVTYFTNSFLVTLIVYFLTPALLGGDGLMEIASGGTMLTIIFKSLLFGTLGLLGLGFLPIVGGFISENAGAQFFALGIISLLIILGNREIRDEIYSFSSTLGDVKLSRSDVSEITPGLWQLLGYLIIAGINIYLFAVPIAFLEAKLKTDGVLLIGAPALQALAALVTIAMVTSYIRLGIENL